MKILEILKGVDLVIADIQVNLGNQKHNNPTLCVKKRGQNYPIKHPRWKTYTNERREFNQD